MAYEKKESADRQTLCAVWRDRIRLRVRDRREVTLSSGLGRSWGADWLCHYGDGVYNFEGDPERGLMQGSLYS